MVEKAEKTAMLTKYLSGLTVLLVLLCATSCGKSETYEPVFTLAEGYALSGDVISGTVYGEGSVTVSDIVSAYDAVIVFSDSTGEQYVEDGEIPLEVGQNRLVLRFTDGKREREYHLEIERILLSSFEIQMLDTDKTYYIGEKFDKSTIRIVAITSEGETIEIDRYDAEYEFSDLGRSTVGIEIGGLYHSFEVDVTEEYIPVLGPELSADGALYSVREGTAALLSAQDAAGFFAVPPYVVWDGTRCPVTEIVEGAFEGCTALTGVRVPDTVRAIGDGAFSGCSSLEWVELPEEMERIGRYVFSGCSSLFSLTIPNGLEEIPDGAFSGCASLIKAVLPDSVVGIGNGAFSGCVSLSSVKCPQNLRSVGTAAFEGCSSLTRVVLGKLDTLGGRAFAGCTGLAVFACAEASDMGENVFAGTASAVLYTAADSGLFHYGSAHGMKTVAVGSEPQLIDLPLTFDIGSEFPYSALCAVLIEDGVMKELSGYSVSYNGDACGTVRVQFVFGDFTSVFSVFVSYVEPVAFDTDSRGAVYRLDEQTRTATLVSLPEYVRKSSVFVPDADGLFLVPTAVVKDGEVYGVTGVEEGASEGCRNVSALLLPDTSS